MKKHLLAISAMIALAAGMASAAPTMYGSNGLFRTISAQNAGPMNYGIGAYVKGWKWDNDSTATAPKSGAMDMAIVPSGYFSINEMFELSVGTNYQMPSRYAEYGGTKYTYNPSGPGDTRAGLKVSIPAGERMWLAAYLGYDIATLSDAFRNPSPQEVMHKYNGSIDIRLLGDLKFGHGGRVNLNAGMYYKLDKQTTLTNNSEANIYPNLSLPIGLGFSYNLGMLTPYAELSAEFTMDTTSYPNNDGTGTVKRGLFDNPTWAGAGLRYYYGGLNITVGGEYNLLTDRSPSPYIYEGDHWHGIFGLAYAPKREMGSKVPVTGIIAGKVTDKATGKGIFATVSAAGITANTTPAGEYRLEGIAIGIAPVEVRAEAKDYLPGSVAVRLARKNKKTPVTQSFVLELKPIPQSEITGNIMDYKTGNPVAAVLSFKDTTGKFLTTKSDYKGAYTIKLDQGKYAVQVGADGYKPKSFIVSPTGGTPVPRQNTFLVKIGEKFIFNDINFTFGKAILGPNAPQILEGIAKILRDNPGIKVEIGGHTDAIGSNAKNQKLSEARAQAVVDWLTTKGIKAEQLEARGYGEDFPVASNKTAAGRALNRRMEVTVVQ